MATVLLLVGAEALPAERTGHPTPKPPLRVFDGRNTRGRQPTILDLVQDSHAILWIATLGGLPSFDGRRFVFDPEAPEGPVASFQTELTTAGAVVGFG